jgi:hypothetical protein
MLLLYTIVKVKYIFISSGFNLKLRFGEPMKQRDKSESISDQLWLFGDCTKHFFPNIEKHFSF